MKVSKDVIILENVMKNTFKANYKLGRRAFNFRFMDRVGEDLLAPEILDVMNALSFQQIFILRINIDIQLKDDRGTWCKM